MAEIDYETHVLCGYDDAGHAVYRVNSHSRSCPGVDGCTCGMKQRISLSTEKALHAAWYKRATEAEADLTEARTKIDEQSRAITTLQQECEYRAQVFMRLYEILGSPEGVVEVAVEEGVRKLKQERKRAVIAEGYALQELAVLRRQMEEARGKALKVYGEGSSAYQALSPDRTAELMKEGKDG